MLWRKYHSDMMKRAVRHPMHPINRPRCQRTIAIWRRKLEWYEHFISRRPPVVLHVRNSPLFLKRLREKKQRELTEKAMLKLARYYRSYIK